MRYLILLAVPGCAPAGAPVTIYAASSLREVAEEIAARTGRPHRIHAEATSTLARQIREGAPADVFLAAAPEWLDAVAPRDRYDWLSNRLVVVVRKDAPVDLRALESLAIAGEHVPAGKYALQALAHEKIPIPSRTIRGHGVRDVLSKVTEGGAQAGIVYATDAAIDPGVRIAHVFPTESHDRIVYSVGLLTEKGRPFFEAFRQEWALEIARRRGFE